MSDDDGLEESNSTSHGIWDETDFGGVTFPGYTLTTIETETSTAAEEPPTEAIRRPRTNKRISFSIIVATCLLVLIASSFHGRLSFALTKPDDGHELAKLGSPDPTEEQHFKSHFRGVDRDSMTLPNETFTLESMLKEESHCSVWGFLKVSPPKSVSADVELSTAAAIERGPSTTLVPLQPPRTSEGDLQSDSGAPEGSEQTSSTSTPRLDTVANTPKESTQSETGPVSAGPKLDLGSFEPPALDGIPPEEGNKKQWDIDVSRARKIATLDRDWKPLPLMRTLQNEQDRAAKAALAAIVQSQKQHAERKYSAEQQAKVSMALEVLEKFGGKSSREIIVVKDFRPCLNTEDSTPSVEFEVKGVLGVGSMAVVFEVEPRDEDLKKLFGGKSMAMKVAIQSVEADAEQDEIKETVDFLAYSVAQEEMVLGEIRAFAENPLRTVERSGIVAPTYRADLEGEGETGLIEGAAFHRRLLFSPVMASDFLTIIRQRGEEGVPLDAKLRTLKRLLMALGHAHAAGLLNNDVKLDNVLVDKEGEAFLIDFGGAARVGEVREVWSKANAAPEQVREIQDGSPMIGTEKGEAWGAGMTCFMALTGQAPFEWDASKSYSKLLFAEAPEVLDPDFNVKQFPSPALPLRRLGVPEEWICVITSLLQPDPQDRPTIRQILQAFPHLFE
ncbi:hypothetical protein Emag_001595 [Eimeria magna]